MLGMVFSMCGLMMRVSFVNLLNKVVLCNEIFMNFVDESSGMGRSLLFVHQLLLVCML